MAENPLGANSAVEVAYAIEKFTEWPLANSAAQDLFEVSGELIGLVAAWQKHRTEHQEHEKKKYRESASLKQQAQTGHR